MTRRGRLPLPDYRAEYSGTRGWGREVTEEIELTALTVAASETGLETGHEVKEKRVGSVGVL